LDGFTQGSCRNFVKQKNRQTDIKDETVGCLYKGIINNGKTAQRRAEKNNRENRNDGCDDSYHVFSCSVIRISAELEKGKSGDEIKFKFDGLLPEPFKQAKVNLV